MNPGVEEDRPPDPPPVLARLSESMAGKVAAVGHRMYDAAGDAWPGTGDGYHYPDRCPRCGEIRAAAVELNSNRATRAAARRRENIRAGD